MAVHVDLNCDMGESFGSYKIGADEEVMQFVTSANIACGLHAGDPVVISRTVAAAVREGIGIGAHPSFPDLQGFGRRYLDMEAEELKNFLIYQIGALKTFAEINGSRLDHVKIHGALYLKAVTDAGLARVAAESIAAVDRELIFVAQAGSQMCRAGEQAGLKVAREFFADRNYDQNGFLLSRRHPRASVRNGEEALERTAAVLKTGKVKAHDGTMLEIGRVDTVCIHGDAPTALPFARLIRRGLEERGISVLPLRKFP